MNIQQYQMQSRGGVGPGNGMPRPSGNPVLDQYKMGLFGKDFPIGRFDGSYQMPTAHAGGQQQLQQPPMMGEPPQMMPYQMRSPGLLPPGGQPGMAMTSRPRPRRNGYRFPQRDINGNVPGAWDYQQGGGYQYPGSRPPMTLY